MPPTHDEVVASLTAPAAPFEIVEEAVRGRPTRTFKTRERSLREKVAKAEVVDVPAGACAAAVAAEHEADLQRRRSGVGGEVELRLDPTQRDGVLSEPEASVHGEIGRVESLRAVLLPPAGRQQRPVDSWQAGSCNGRVAAQSRHGTDSR